MSTQKGFLCKNSWTKSELLYIVVNVVLHLILLWWDWGNYLRQVLAPISFKFKHQLYQYIITAVAHFEFCFLFTERSVILLHIRTFTRIAQFFTYEVSHSHHFNLLSSITPLIMSNNNFVPLWYRYKVHLKKIYVLIFQRRREVISAQSYYMYCNISLISLVAFHICSVQEKLGFFQLWEYFISPQRTYFLHTWHLLEEKKFWRHLWTIIYLWECHSDNRSTQGMLHWFANHGLLVMSTAREEVRLSEVICTGTDFCHFYVFI